MKYLSDILYKVNLLEVIGSTGLSISQVCFDSRKVQEKTLFVAVKGTISDGHQFIEMSIDKGAVAIVCEEFPRKLIADVTYIKVPDASIALSIMADNYYDHPSSKIKIIGVTGTNGKTTVATLLYRLFTELGHKCGLLSTVENKIADTIIAATHTTPDALVINELLHEMIQANCEYCFMEVSSHAIQQNRVASVTFSGALFTNITHDHLDYHLTFENYLSAKKKLFDLLPASAFALTNIDDRRGSVMLQNTKARKYTYSMKASADFTAKVLENSFSGLLLNLDGVEVYSNLVGSFNAYNLLCIYAAARLAGQEKIDVLTAISKLSPAEGRFDYVVSGKNKIIGIVDYAHTPDALEKVLETIKDIRTGAEQLITIIGCGGNRDALKRPAMANVASELSDKVILTSDNPRNEDPSEILRQMQKGIQIHKASKTLTIEDRREAIKTAVALANDNDIILLAGKGHEKYQEVKGVRFPFDDKKILFETFKAMDK